MYLLDTTHCSRILQGDPSIIRKLSELDDAPVATCAIVQGELVFMARKSERSDENLSRVKSFLEDIEVYPLDSETADIYGKLKADILDRFGPKEKAKRRKARIEAFGFTDNDLWIAAAAKRYGFAVVSADSDFGRLREISDLEVENWYFSKP